MSGGKVYVDGFEVGDLLSTTWGAGSAGKSWIGGFDPSMWGASKTFNISFTRTYAYRYGMVTRSRGGALYMLLGNADERGVAPAIRLRGWGGVGLGRVTTCIPANQEMVE